MLVFLLVILLAGLGGFGYWAYNQGYLKSLPFKFGSDNTTGKAVQTAKYTTPPTISNVKVTGTTTKQAGVTWNTDQPSSSQVEYGASASYGLNTDVSDDPSTGSSLGVVTHGVTVKDLTPNTTYHYRVISKNNGGLEAKSGDNTFTTAAEQ